MSISFRTVANHHEPANITCGNRSRSAHML